MNSMIIKTNKQDKSTKSNVLINEIISDSSFLQQWENIKHIPLASRGVLFNFKSVNANLWRKFSFQNSVEKYSLKTEDDKVLGNIDLKVYKDSVYIINLDIKAFKNFNQIVTVLLQVAIEKALYNTTDKKVIFNLLMPLLMRSKAKKVLENTGFIQESAQSEYEKEIFGETYIMEVENSALWQKKIKQMPILINR